MKKFIVFIVVLLPIAQTSIAQELRTDREGWTLIGTRVVDFTLDRDVVSFGDRVEIFTALSFIVKTGTINMHKCIVHFTDGDTREIEFTNIKKDDNRENDVNKSNDGLILDLKGSNRTIEKIIFWYDTKNHSKTESTVEIWGEK